MKALRTVAKHSRSQRDGTTLTEVLMSILCMGIGVVAVASLFPIALLRSVQATQMTEGTILRFNAETLIDLDQKIVFDPNVNNDFNEHFNRTYLVDPLGWNIASGDGRPAAEINAVGNMGRFNLGVTTENAAGSFVTLPDSWVTMLDDFPTGSTTTSATMPSAITAEITQALADGQTLRVVLFDETGKLSETRPLIASNVSGATVSWARALPADYPNNSIARVRIEVQERRYTWMLTVRNFTTSPTVPQALVDVVVFFRRAAGVEDETPYTLAGSGRTYTVNKINATDPDPFLKKGGFMLDTNTGTWHRIAKSVSGSLVITLERNIPASTTLNNNRVVFMRGVIDVYPLGTKP